MKRVFPIVAHEVQSPESFYNYFFYFDLRSLGLSDNATSPLSTAQIFEKEKLILANISSLAVSTCMGYPQINIVLHNSQCLLDLPQTAKNTPN